MTRSVEAPKRSVGLWLLLVTVVVACGLALALTLRIRAHLARAERLSKHDSYLEIEAPGPKWLQDVVPIDWLEAFGTVRGLHIDCRSPYGRDGSRFVSSTVDMFADIDDAELAAVVGEVEHLPDLEVLEVVLAGFVTERGWKVLSRLRHVRELTIVGSIGNDRVLADLVANLCELRHVDLTFNAVGDATCRELASLPHLETLVLGHTAVGDEGLAFLAKAPQLKSLSLSNTNVTEAGLGPLLERTPDLQYSDD